LFPKNRINEESFLLIAPSLLSVIFHSVSSYFYSIRSNKIRPQTVLNRLLFKIKKEPLLFSWSKKKKKTRLILPCLTNSINRKYILVENTIFSSFTSLRNDVKVSHLPL